MPSTEQLHFSFCLDGLPINLLDLSSNSYNRLHRHNITQIEETARISLITPLAERNELLTLIEQELRDRLSGYTVYCYILAADVKAEPAQFVIESDLFYFVASIKPAANQTCTCVYQWCEVEHLSNVPFHAPSQVPTSSPPITTPLVSYSTLNTLTEGKLPPTSMTTATMGYRQNSTRSGNRTLKESIFLYIKSNPREIPINQLALSNRTIHALLRGGIDTLEKLIHTPDVDLLRIHSFGQKSLHEVTVLLQKINSLRTEDRNVEQNIDNYGFEETNVRPDLIKSIREDILCLPIRVLDIDTEIRDYLREINVCTIEELVQLTQQIQYKKHNLKVRYIPEITSTLLSMNIDELSQVPEHMHQQGQIPERIFVTVDFQGSTLYKLQLLGIETLSDLCQFTHENLEQLGLPNVYIKECSLILKAYGLHLADFDRGAITTILTRISPEVMIEKFLGRLDDRQRDLIVMRYGLAATRKLTLEEIGNILGCTRERVRQIEKKALNILHLAPNYSIIQPLIFRLEQALQQAHGVMSTNMTTHALYGEENLYEHAEHSVLFLLNFAENIQLIKSMPILHLTNTAFAPFTQHTCDICSVFKQVITNALAPIPLSDVLSRFTNHHKGRQLAEYVNEPFLIACLEAHPDIVITDIDGQISYGLKQWSNKRLDDMVLVLREHGQPLHYREIAERVNQRLPAEQQTTAHNIHAHIGRMPDVFVRVGHGIFGLAEWGLIQDRNLADGAYRVLKETGHALPLEQLIDRVLETWHVRRTSVKAAIDLDDRFQQVGRNLYWIKEVPQTHTTAGTTAPSMDFDQMFGSLLLQRQQDLERDRMNSEQTNHLEEIRRLDIDLLR